ncbi:MAG TPA: CUAEP/CCAEP-tail radical SAM protein [Candidatus Polarisedimenticolia bacterium]|nr:CUAEP/CCAEP-tail radical SAM protein [Candidatus Polarisedimenticolia bacterium]
MRAPGAILLISTYELGRQPLSLASPLAALEEAGFSPAALDLAVERLDPQSVRRARLAAVAVPMHTALRLGVKAVERIRSINPACRIALYGLYARLNAASLLARGADFIIGPECEYPLLRLAHDLDRGGTGLDLEGVGTLEDIAGPPAPAVPWRRIPFVVPRRASLPPLDRYARLEHEGGTRLAGQTEASRGCLHLCRHCPIPPVYGGRFLVVPRDVVLADIRNQVAAGATHITFGDPDFLNGPGHSLAILRSARAEFPGLTFDFTAKISHLLKHRDLLPEMARLGCLFVVSAVESIDDHVLAILDKGHTRADVEAAIGLTRGAGIALRPSLVPFNPWTGLREYRDLLAFIERHDLIDHLDPVQLVIRLLLPPGSLLIGHPAMRPHLGALDPGRFTYEWSHPDPGMDRLHRELSRLVEEAAIDGEDPRLTFDRIVSRAGDRPIQARSPIVHDKGRPPRLTEPWFC